MGSYTIDQLDRQIKRIDAEIEDLQDQKVDLEEKRRVLLRFGTPSPNKALVLAMWIHWDKTPKYRVELMAGDE